MSLLDPSLSIGRKLAPGVILCVVVAAAAIAIQRIPGLGVLSPLIIAALIGMICRSTLNIPEQTKAGILFSAKALLRFAIVMLGLQVSLSQIALVGWDGFVVAGIAVSATFVFTIWFGRLIGANARLVELIAAGTSVCGASAIVATNAVTRADDEDVAYALGSITFFGTLAVVTYPMVMAFTEMSQSVYGLWVGASIHEVAQVIAAGAQGGPDAVTTATIVKLVRVLMLAPLVMALAWSKRRAEGGAKSSRPLPVPGFVLGFIAMVIASSALSFPPIVIQLAGTLTLTMLTVALAAIGLMTSFNSVVARGLKPLLVAAASTIFIGTICLLMAVAAGPSL